MSELTPLLEKFRETYEGQKKHDEERAAIVASPEYQELAAKLAAMTAHVPNWGEELNALKDEILATMNAEGITFANGFTVKTRTSKSVDVRGVLEALGGDIDNLMLVATVPQKNLEGFIKDNPDFKRDLRSCIRVEGTKVVDLVPSAN